MHILRTFATAVAIPVLLVACSSDSDTSGDTTAGATTAGATTAGATTAGATTAGATTAGTTRKFFNDTDGIGFANTIGGGFSNAFTAILGGVGGGSSSGSSSSISQRMARLTETNSVACGSSGTIAVSSTTDDATSQPTGFGLTFNNCLSDGALSTGGVSITIGGAEPSQSVSVSFNDFSSVENGATNSINGTVEIAATSTNGATSTTISGSTITMVSDGETITYSNYNLASSQDSAGAASLSGAATISTSDGGTLMMSVNPALTTVAGGDYPETGTVSWSHSDGSSLSIDADTGDAATFSYVISDGASTTSDVGNWADTDIGGIAP